MADITVQVSSAGLTAYGSDAYGYGSFGGNATPIIQVQTTQAYNLTGWGGQTWSFANWGDLANASAPLTGIQLQSNTDGVTAYPNQGWGGQNWGFAQWGELVNANSSITGIQLQSTASNVIAFPQQGWGGKQWGANLWGDLINNAATPAGIQLTATLGNEEADGEINSGWGRLTWGSNIWNGYGTLIPTGIQINTPSIGSVTVTGEINEGWGRLTWGENAWGAAGDVVAQGNELTISSQHNKDAWGAEAWNGYNTSWGGVGSVNIAINQEINITGLNLLNITQGEEGATGSTVAYLDNTNLSLTQSLGTVDPAPDVMPSGVSIATSLGTIQAYNEQGWGRDDWGAEVWGAEGEWAFVNVTGLDPLSVDSGIREYWGQDEWGASTTEWGGTSITDVDISVNVPVTSTYTPGWGADIAWGAQAWGDATVDMSMTMDTGQTDPEPDVSLTGQQIDFTIGVETIVGTANVPVTGTEITLTLGNEDAFTNVTVQPTGLEIGPFVIGDYAAGISILVEPTGVTSTVSTGIIGLNAWAVVDPGTAPTWTVVDIAA